MRLLLLLWGDIDGDVDSLLSLLLLLPELPLSLLLVPPQHVRVARVAAEVATEEGAAAGDKDGGDGAGDGEEDGHAARKRDASCLWLNVEILPIGCASAWSDLPLLSGLPGGRRRARKRKRRRDRG